ncbi:28S ribosomal protein S11, mitochondrial isoform X1 [Bubalus bubalis]|uniref:28S ribosomal protein S11, mitochondrial isoform X1 n=1 Tax=Bubalus bubalis TaxID=89462 RepID=UPI001D11743C|nr:28S ribosomal protein S11, mitochondrial isoform X1 [Bubalus bubalis]
MQVVRNAGSWLLRPWAWPPTTRVVAGVPAPTIHMSAQQMQDAAAKEEVEKAETPAPAPSRSSFSIYPPIPGQESSLRWAGKKFEEIPIAHIKASYNNTQIQVVSAAHQPLARASCGTEGFRNAKKGTGIAAQTAGIAAAAVESYRERRDPRPSCGQRPGARALVCHQGPDHGGPGSDLNHRQHPHPTQRLPPQEGAKAVRARKPAPDTICLQLGLVENALSSLSRQGSLRP